MIPIINTRSKILVQGITTRLGAAFTELALAYGTRITAGISREKGLQEFLSIPLYKTVKEAAAKTGADVSIIFATVGRAPEETLAAIKEKIPLIICTTEHIPLQDVLMLKEAAHKAGVKLLGPSSAGLVIPPLHLVLGTIPAHLFPEGHIGIIARSSSLTYEVIQQLKIIEEGVSQCIMLGSLPILGADFVPAVKTLLADKRTERILLIGDISGSFEQAFAKFYAKHRKKKPIFAYIPGRFLPPPGRPPLLGSSPYDPPKIAQEKIKALKNAGVHVITSLSDIALKLIEKEVP